jgi:hypothetical protein
MTQKEATPTTYSSPAWHGWEFDADGCYLVSPQPHEYVVRLGGVSSSAALLDWVSQVAKKSWAREDPKIMAGMMNAVMDICQPQKHLCSMGTEQSPEDYNRKMLLGYCEQIVQDRRKAAKDPAEAYTMADYAEDQLDAYELFKDLVTQLFGEEDDSE